MKNIKKIISLLCAMLMVLSISAFAFELEENHEINFKIKTDKTAYSTGDTVVITLYTDSISGTMSALCANASLFYKSSDLTLDTSVADQYGTVSTSSANLEGYDMVAETMAMAGPYTVDMSAIVTYKFTLNSTTDTTVELRNCMLMDNTSYQTTSQDEQLISDSLTIKVGADEPTVITHEEDFADDVKDLADPAKGDVKEDTYTSASKVSFNGSEIDMAAGSKAYTFFAKAAKDLKANSYGVTVNINGVGYKFPGIADVAEGNAWAIKLVIPEGKFGGDGKAIESVDTFAAYGNN